MIGVTLFCVVIGGFVGRRVMRVRERLRLQRQIAVSTDPFDDEEFAVLREADRDERIDWFRRLIGDREVPSLAVSKKISAEDLKLIEDGFPESEIKQLAGR